MPERVHTEIDSPIGPLTLVATDGVLSGLFMDAQRHRPPPERFGPRGRRDAEPFPAVTAQLEAYFAGELIDFDVDRAALGSPFQHEVWNALTEIPYGETVSYGQIAARIGRPGSARAVGLANGANPISIIVPCHRVVGADGSLTGYGGGLERKQHLLDLERWRVTPALFSLAATSVSVAATSRHTAAPRRTATPRR